MIDLNKKYKTASGLEVELYKVKENSDYPVIGAVKLEHSASCGWLAINWNLQGEELVGIDEYKLIEQHNFKPSFILERYTKLFEYFGLPLSIPNEIQWLATDEDGTLYGYFTEPYCVNLDSLPDQGYWDQAYWDDDKEGVKIAKIQIIGDWKQSLMNVN